MPDAGDQRGQRGPDPPSTTAPTTTARNRRVSSAQTNRMPGWSLIGRAEGHADPEPDGLVQPAPAEREQEEQERPHLAELDGVGERPGQAGQQDDPPADCPADGQDRRPERRTIRSAAPVQTQTAVVADRTRTAGSRRRTAAGSRTARTRRSRRSSCRTAARRSGSGLPPGGRPGSRSRGCRRRRPTEEPTKVTKTSDREDRQGCPPETDAAAEPPSRRRRAAPVPTAMDERDPEEVPGDAHREPRPGSHPRSTPVVPVDRARSRAGSRGGGPGR